jgi:hypothetical protein
MVFFFAARLVELGADGGAVRAPCELYRACAHTSPTWLTRIKPALWRCSAALSAASAMRGRRRARGRGHARDHAQGLVGADNQTVQGSK